MTYCCRPAARLALLLLALGSCTVYTPMQPTTPLLRQRGQGEAGLSLQPSGRLEMTGAYSPLPRLALVGGLTGSPRLWQDNYVVTAQYEVGAGIYQPLGQHGLLCGIGGVGSAYSRRGYSVSYTSFPPSYQYADYEARYRKRFVQLGVAYSRRHVSLLATYRFTWAQLDYVYSSTQGLLPPSLLLRHETSFSSRFSIPALRRLQPTVSLGLSLGGRLNQDPTAGFYNPGGLTPALLVGVGAVYQLGPSRVVPRKVRPAVNRPVVPDSVRRKIWLDRLGRLHRLLP